MQKKVVTRKRALCCLPVSLVLGVVLGSIQSAGLAFAADPPLIAADHASLPVITAHIPNQKAPLIPVSKTPDVADISCEDLRAGGDPDRRYLLLSAAKTDIPADGYRLLLVLPGGNGGPDFNPFVKRIVKNALPSSYIVAQLVAPEWTPVQAKSYVWPCRNPPITGARFTTEEFMESVISEIASKRHIDRRYIFALGWSSGGPPVYAEALSPKSSLTGAFVAMSVFHPSILPDMAGAKGKAFYIFHSTGDFIPIAQAEQACDQLAAAGAHITLKIATGGHGWFGDVYGNIRAGISFLQENAAPPSATAGESIFPGKP